MILAIIMYFILSLVCVIGHNLIITMMMRIKIAKYRFCQLSLNQKVSTLAYPFEYTPFIAEFKYFDPRFSEYPATRRLYPKQSAHIQLVLQIFNQVLNQQKIKSQDHLSYVYATLHEKIALFQDQLRQQQMKAHFDIDEQSFSQSKGYLQFYGANAALDCKENQGSALRFMHQYKMDKENEKVKCTLREEKQDEMSTVEDKRKEEEKIKQDLDKMMNKKAIGEKIKQKLFGDSLKRTDQLIKVVDFMNSIGRKDKKFNDFEKYIHVDRIDGHMNVEFKSHDQTVKFEKIPVFTKWLYFIDSNEPEDIRRSRKRVLFDFQLWNRGTFIPVKNFVQQ